VLQAALGTDLDLGGQPVVVAVDGCAEDAGEPGFDERFAADDEEDATLPRVTATGPADSVEIASPHGSI
jgi:hypothetical protein